MRAPLFLLAALLAGPAVAQEPAYEPAILTACLAAGTDQRDGCIGKASDQCMLAPGGDTTVGMSTCLGQEVAQWDALLNGAYAKVMAEAEATDAEMKTLGSAAPPQVPALREMQRAWIGFRDAACGYEASRWGGGSGAGPAATSCAMELTARQALRLMAYADQQR